MPLPAVSVVLPTYNRAHLLPRAIASVLGQSERDFELIVVDDGSTDDTAAVVRGFADPRIVYLPPERNLGDAGARNRGVARARGAWIAFQDSDDEWLPDKLQRQLALAAAQPRAQLIGGGSLRFSAPEVATHAWPLATGAGAEGGAVDLPAWLATGIANLQALMVRRETLQALGGFDTGYRTISDADFVYRLAAHCPDGLFAVPRLVTLMYETPGSLILDLTKLLHDERRLLQQHADLLRRHPAAHARMLYRLALTELQCGNLPASRACAREALRASPWFWRPWAFLALSLGGARLTQAVRRASQARRRRVPHALR